ncbi:MAG: hypothetical protein HRT58_10925 [Crocinitomicaceae bacterium]|nr:hypothetical protein [Flavobacteriales bacterium]NQZ36168.1 hypothetical protein [Crocinitomicaceae bacterium]
MQGRNLIITLIQQDLKHQQLIERVEDLISIEKEKHHLELLHLVQELMKVPETAELDWGKTYCKYMGIASWFPLESTSDGLRNQAEMCFTHLQAIVEVENEHQYIPN